jgi:hypothetical protein
MTAKWLVLAVLAAVIGQGVRETLSTVAAKLGPKWIDRAVGRVPPSRREIRRAEWLAEFEWLAAKNAYFLCLKYAAGVWLGAVRIGYQSARHERPVVDSKAFKGPLGMFRWLWHVIVTGDLVAVAAALVLIAVLLPTGMILISGGTPVETGLGAFCLFGCGLYAAMSLAIVVGRARLVRNRRRQRSASN